MKISLLHLNALLRRDTLLIEKLENIMKLNMNIHIVDKQCEYAIDSTFIIDSGSKYMRVIMRVNISSKEYWRI